MPEARLFGAIFLTEHIGVGLESTATYATFDGGPYESDPTMARRPFALYEVGVGVAVTGRF